MDFEQSPLPLAKMESLLSDAKIKYREGAPFPHVVFIDSISIDHQFINTSVPLTINRTTKQKQKGERVYECVVGEKVF